MHIFSPESNDLPAHQMPDLSSPGPHKVNGQGCGLLHWTISQSCLLCSPENSEGAGIEEGQVPQLTVLVSW